MQVSNIALGSLKAFSSEDEENNEASNQLIRQSADQTIGWSDNRLIRQSADQTIG